MKFTIALLLIMLLSFVLCLYFPWWSIAIASFVVVAFVPLKPAFAFLCGFTSIFLLWTILSFIISNNNDHLLAGKVALLVLKVRSSFLLILLTGLIGGITAGMAALTASFLRSKQLAVPEHNL